jgi:DNA-binding IscR family transcriptional regulator
MRASAAGFTMPWGWPRRDPREGRSGGYVLAKPPRARCAIATVMDDAQEAWWQTLRQCTLEDLRASITAQVDPGIRDRARQWLGERTRS